MSGDFALWDPAMRGETERMPMMKGCAVSPPIYITRGG